MVSKRRIMDALNNQRPDKVPVIYSPSLGGLYAHGRKLLDLFKAYPPDNFVDFDEAFEEVAAARQRSGDTYYEISQDDWGVTWEYLAYGTPGGIKEHSFSDWSQVENFEFPSVPSAGDEDYQEEQAKISKEKVDSVAFRGEISLLDKLVELRSESGMLGDMMTGNDAFCVFFERLVDYWGEMINYYLSLGVDVIFIKDNWGSEFAQQLIDNEVYPELFKEVYQKLFAQIKQGGGKVFFQSYKLSEKMFDELLQLGIDGIWTLSPLHEDPNFLVKCKQNKVTAYIQPDRDRLMPLGTPEDIDKNIYSLAKQYSRQLGGAMFHVEIEDDTPFENAKALLEALNKYR